MPRAKKTPAKKTPAKSKKTVAPKTAKRPATQAQLAIASLPGLEKLCEQFFQARHKQLQAKKALDEARESMQSSIREHFAARKIATPTDLGEKQAVWSYDGVDPKTGKAKRRVVNYIPRFEVGVAKEEKPE